MLPSKNGTLQGMGVATPRYEGVQLCNRGKSQERRPCCP